MDPETFIAQTARWAQSQPNIHALALVGSWARGAAQPDSDVDLVLLCQDPNLYLADYSWLSHFGSAQSVTPEDWGAVQSLRVFYQRGPEVEFGITTPAWAAAHPVDPGTARVARDGLRALYDPSGLLASLQQALHP